MDITIRLAYQNCVLYCVSHLGFFPLVLLTGHASYAIHPQDDTEVEAVADAELSHLGF